MKPAAKGYMPASGFLWKQISLLHGPADEDLPSYEFRELDTLLDSVNMQPADWVKIARVIQSLYDDFSGFVVVHGTDTMTYTASALAFLLEGLDKPVILTGAQRPLHLEPAEGIENIVNSLQFAARFELPEVCICFAGRLLRGCRAVKVNANQPDAFQSPNYPLLGKVAPQPTVDWAQVRVSKIPSAALSVQIQRQARVGVLRLFPGITSRFIERALDEPWDGLILQTYGAGSAPTTDPVLLSVLEDAVANGLVIVNVSQCLQGSVHNSRYETASVLRQAGILSGGDMTTEAALTKLFYLFGNNLPHDQLGAAVQSNLRGEITEGLINIEHS